MRMRVLGMLGVAFRAGSCFSRGNNSRPEICFRIWQVLYGPMNAFNEIR